uniref:hypothetical protein n=1 Tax=Castellaniella defragrans TaxID=75697 RepID=UPI003341C74A
MDKKGLAQRMYDADLRMRNAIWLGGIEVDSPPEILADWAYDGDLESLGMKEGEELYDFLSEHEDRMPFIAELEFAVPRNFTFREDGSASSWSTGGVYKSRLFLGDAIEDCIEQACVWAESEFLRLENEARAAAKGE